MKELHLAAHIFEDMAEICGYVLTGIWLILLAVSAWWAVGAMKRKGEK